MASNIKLYPPTIENSIPAFYEDEGKVVLAIPFSMNKAVSYGDIGGFKIKIKTAYSNNFIDNKEVTGWKKSNNPLDIVNFIWEENFPFEVGEFYKIQMAYLANDGTTEGFYSNVGIVKFTGKPEIKIQGFEDTNKMFSFRESYTGVYTLPENDRNERPYSYNFCLYDKDYNLLEESGWLLHNSSFIVNQLGDLTIENEVTDTYNFLIVPKVREKCYIQYSVKTLNGLEISTPLYKCMNVLPSSYRFEGELNAINVYGDGYVNLEFVKVEDEDGLLSNAGMVSIVRSELDYNQDEKDSHIIHTASFSNVNILKEYNYQDFLVEQGVSYKYRFDFYKEDGLCLGYLESNIVMVDFEDMFLLGADERQIKIRFNPKMGSFKTTIQEQKTDTIGGKHPFFFRNGMVEYKEFPINGLISYLMDENQLFIDLEKDLNLVDNEGLERAGTPDNSTSQNETDQLAADQNFPTTNLVGYNVFAERKFKLILLDWLSNGETKLFKSPTEGNYLVRLMNVSLSPEDTLGRMLHSFSCMAYETHELNYSNLVTLGFANEDEVTEDTLGWESVILKDRINETRLNKRDVYSQLEIIPAKIIGGNTSYLKIKLDGQEVIITKPTLIKTSVQNITLGSEEGLSTIGDTIISYDYKVYASNPAIVKNQIRSIGENTYITDEIGTLFGPAVILQKETVDNQIHEVMDCYSLKFKENQESLCYNHFLINDLFDGINWQTTYGDISFKDNIITYIIKNKTGQDHYNYGIRNDDKEEAGKILASDIILTMCDVFSNFKTHITLTRLETDKEFTFECEAKKWYRLISRRGPVTRESASSQIFLCSPSDLSNIDYSPEIFLSNYYSFDLTKIFGVRNEPELEDLLIDTTNIKYDDKNLHCSIKYIISDPSEPFSNYFNNLIYYNKNTTNPVEFSTNIINPNNIKENFNKIIVSPGYSLDYAIQKKTINLN